MRLRGSRFLFHRPSTPTVLEEVSIFLDFVRPCDEIQPVDLPNCYSSAMDNTSSLPIFQADLDDANLDDDDWTRYRLWLREATGLDQNAALAESGHTVVTVCDARTLRPCEWLNDTILTYFTDLFQNSPRFHKTSALFFSPFFVTKLFNLGHEDEEVVGTFAYRNVKGWLAPKLRLSNK